MTKLQKAQLHNQYVRLDLFVSNRFHHVSSFQIVINRALYKILIENAFNPQTHRAEEIERYLETLLKAYDAELEAIRKRTQVNIFLLFVFIELFSSVFRVFHRN